MIKGITLLLSAVLIISGCTSKAQVDKRKELITKFISATENHDTIQLYTLVDTISNFKIHTRQTFWDQISYINSRLKICGDTIIDSSVKIYDVAAYSKEYILPFCRGKNGEIMHYSFDMHFTFADYDNDAKIRYFDVVFYSRNITPTIAPPDQK